MEDSKCETQDLIPVHIKHLKTFIKEYGAKKGFLVGRFSRVQKIGDGILALPWQQI